VTWEEPFAGGTVEWYTPPRVFEALGLRFDLDVAAPRGGVAWVPAERYLTIDDNALMSHWTGRVWLNPPYGPTVGLFLDRLAHHGDGVALVAARTATRWWQRAAATASAVCFIAGRLQFIRSDGHVAPAAFPSCLLAWGPECAAAVLASQLGVATKEVSS
jgi:hypothetical protein